MLPIVFSSSCLPAGCSISVVASLKSDPLTLTNKRPGGSSLYAVLNKAEQDSPNNEQLQFLRDDG
ncbi:hypothetical protein BTUL_0128g00120 [Botrytis tulipae]|uniref:Uncharacterized protein n=1 Tax=Botrytis tulipae TaxID=87230 RepID=A0A4Z1EJC0_9HELO|nr:hypothetical protein BTUL_0128g00120 [Botrytis tulipae]